MFGVRLAQARAIRRERDNGASGPPLRRLDGVTHDQYPRSHDARSGDLAAGAGRGGGEPRRPAEPDRGLSRAGPSPRVGGVTVVSDSGMVRLVAELRVVFLPFDIGLHSDASL